ncbi:MAG: hypothetical protein NTY77_13470 [Elusimicrobia bacterium]|nr:hypothetical protein [Elusimicrobiota bacterium]
MLAPALAVLICLLCAAPRAFAGSTAPPAPIDWVANSGAFLTLYRDVQTQAAKAYLAGDPIEKALSSGVLQQLSGKIPPDNGAQGVAMGAIPAPLARDKVRGLSALREQAMAVQLGRHPDDPIEVHHQAIGIAAEGLLGRKPADTEKAQLLKLYGDRVRGGAAQNKPKTQAELMMDAEAARRLLADARLSPQVSSRVTAKAGEYAKALGGLLFTDGNGNAVIVGRRDPKAVLTQAELAAIARLPRVQLPAGLGGLDRKVPAPVSAISEKAPQMGEPGFEYGWATGAWKFWDDMEKRQDDVASQGHWIQAGTVATGAKVMKFFYHLSGFGAMEKSGDQTRWDKNRGAGVGTLIWDGTKVAANTALAALNFVPVVAAVSKAGGLVNSARGIVSGTEVYRTARAGSEIVELSGGVGKTVAGEVAGEVRGIVQAAAGEGAQVTTKTARQVLTGLKEAGASKNVGITVVEDRSLLGMGMAEGDASTIVINTRLGGAHEVTHAVQQYQVRATLLRQMGKSYDKLSEAEKLVFADRVKAVELQAYNQFENGAYRATGWMGSGSLNGARYAKGLEANISAFEGGLAGGTVPKFALTRYSPGATAYGALPNWLGRSQVQIGTNIGAVISMGRPLGPTINDVVGAGVEKTMDFIYAAPAAPVAPKGGKR